MASDIFQSALVKKPQRARFDFSHFNEFGMKIGYAYPTEVRFIVPGDEASVSMSQVARLAPMPVPTFADLKVRHDWFFVPCRLLYNEQDMSLIFGAAGTGQSKARPALTLNRFINTFSAPINTQDYDNVEPSDWGTDIPTAFVNLERKLGDLYTPGSLFDFLGYPVPDDRVLPAPVDFGDMLSDLENAFTFDYNDTITGDFNGLGTKDQFDALRTFYMTFDTYLSQGGYEFTSAKVLLEPLLAYHFIWRDWYRFTGVEDNSVSETYLENHVLSAVSPSIYTGTLNATDKLSSIIGHSSYIHVSDANDTIGMVLGRLRQVHLTKDMFTSVRYGSKPTVLIPTGANANIPTLREASAIQRFIDLVSVVGSRYYDKIKALFNVKATGFADDRVQFLARYQQFIKIGEVLTTSTTDLAKTGDYAGRGILIDGKYLFKRRFDEPGWLFCISSIVPDVAYTGLSRQMTDTYFVDTPVPSLAQIGDQTVYNREVSFNWNVQHVSYNDLSFGDQFRYYAYKSAPNEVHGSFRMSSLRSWVPTQDYVDDFNVIGFSKVNPVFWNKFFNAVSTSPIYGDRFWFKIDFSEYITRQLPKYINYHL